MIKKIKYYIKEIILFLFIMTVILNIVSIYKSTTLNKQNLNLHDITLLDNTTYKLSDTKPTLVHIWAIWCPTCKLEASNIQYLSKHFNVLTIAVKSGLNDDVSRWLQSNKYSFNVVNDNSGFIASELNIQAFPTTLIYNKDKELIFSDVGYSSTLSLYLKMIWASF